jgi:Ca2+-transporting ATPase
MVPADGVILTGEVSVGQASLTGEPDAVKKTAHKQKDKYTPKDETDLSDLHLVFRGSVVEDGEAVVKIRVVGLKTTFGEIYAKLSEADERDSPLQGK